MDEPNTLTATGQATINDKAQAVMLTLQSIDTLARIIKPTGGSSTLQIAAEAKILELIKLL
jgi:hypothetical protein